MILQFPANELLNPQACSRSFGVDSCLYLFGQGNRELMNKLRHPK